jgi:hypothetical protein
MDFKFIEQSTLGNFGYKAKFKYDVEVEIDRDIPGPGKYLKKDVG